MLYEHTATSLCNTDDCFPQHKTDSCVLDGCQISDNNNYYSCHIDHIMTNTTRIMLWSRDDGDGL